MIRFLWANRERPPFGTRRWVVVWGKRVLQFSALMGLMRIRRRFRSRGAQIDDGAVVYDFSVQGPYANIRIGEGCFIATRVHLAPDAPITIGKRVVINDGVTILSASHALSDPKWRKYSKAIRIDDYAWIATNATILPGVHIGEGAVVGAGAVVRDDVEPYSIVTGNPAVAAAKRRVSPLDYNPALFSAPLEAWIGRRQQTTLGAGHDQASADRAPV